MATKPLPKNTRYRPRTTTPAIDFAQMKLDFFWSQHATVSEFLRSNSIKTNGRINNKTVWRWKEKQKRKELLLENAKRDIEKNIKERTKKFYENMRNVMMSHAQELIEIETKTEKDWSVKKTMKFRNLKEAREAIQEVRTFNWDTNNIRDFGLRENPDGWRMANVQFVFSDGDDDEW